MQRVEITFTKKYLTRKNQEQLDASEKIFEYAKPIFRKINLNEMIIGIFLDHRLNLNGHSILGFGPIHSVTVEPKEIISYALVTASSNVILVHNHPGGANCSKEDIAFTERVKKMLNFFDIKLVDHVIIKQGGKVISHQSMKADHPNLFL